MQLIYLCLFDSLTDEESRKNWEDYGNPDGPEGNNPFLSSPTSCTIQWFSPSPPPPPPQPPPSATIPPSLPFVLIFYFFRISWCLIGHLPIQLFCLPSQVFWLMHLLLLRDLLLWSNLVCSLQFSSSIASFKSALRTHLFSSEYWIHCCMACVYCCRWPVCLCNEWDIVLGSVYFCWPCCFCTLWLGLRSGVNALYLTWASITQYKNNKANKNIRNQAQYPTHYITWGKK